MRELVNFDSGERLELCVEDKALVSVSQKSGKTKQSKKEFASETEAKKACVKKGALSCKIARQKPAKRACMFISAVDTLERSRLQA